MESNPIFPPDWIAHCIIPHAAKLPDFQRYLAEISSSLPGIDGGHSWTTLGGSRGIAYGDFRLGNWQWRVVMEAGTIPASLDAVVHGCIGANHEIPLRRHRSHVINFLVGGPSPCGALEPIRQLSRITWPWLELGAELVIWPDGGTASTVDELRIIDPAAINEDHLYHFVSTQEVGADSRGQHWFRTYGLQQFLLPDLACVVPLRTAPYLKAVKTCLASVPPYLIQIGRPLSPGETLNLDSSTWEVVNEAVTGPAPFVSRFGVQIHRRLPRNVGNV